MTLQTREDVKPITPPTLVRQKVVHPESRDVGMVFEIVNEEIDLFGQAARLFQQLAELDCDLFSDGLAELLAVSEMLVGRTAIQAGSLGDLDDGQAVGAPFGEEIARGGDEGLVRSLCIAPERPLSGAGEKIPLRLVSGGFVVPLWVRFGSFAHFWIFLRGFVSDRTVACIKAVMYVGFTLARQTRIATGIAAEKITARTAWS